MSAAARAFAWEFRSRVLLGLSAFAAYLIVFFVIKVAILGDGHPIEMNPPNGLAAFVIAPASAGFFYFVGVFSYGLTGDLAARQSMYPSRLFTQPVTTRALAGWPMLYGTVAVASLWIITAALLRWPGGVDVYIPWWPALPMAAFLAWTQAFMWMPYGLPGVRIAATALWLAIVDAVVVISLHFEASETLMIAICAPQIPLAYLVACRAVARARRGVVPDWRRRGAEASPAADRPQLRFRSAAAAQTWFEWKRHGRTLPTLVAIAVPCELALLFIPGFDGAPMVFLILSAALVTPPFLAAFAAPALSTSTAFIARRPLTTAALVAAKIRMTVWSTLAAWLLAITLVLAALVLSDRMPVVVERLQAFSGVAGPVRATAAVALLMAGLVASTWKHLVQSLCIGLSGREWLIRSSVLLAMTALVAAGPLVDALLGYNAFQSVVWNGLPWILTGLVTVKLIAGSWVAIRLYDSRLLSDRVLVAGAAGWLVTVAALYAVFVWSADSPLFPRYVLGGIAILMVPLARVSAAPLALAWSRHR
jgi:hypothetical protein